MKTLTLQDVPNIFEISQRLNTHHAFLVQVKTVFLKHISKHSGLRTEDTTLHLSSEPIFGMI